MQLIKERGATLLYKDFLVRQWMQWRAEREPGAAKLREHGDYVQVTMNEMDDFYSYKSTNFIPGRVELPDKELLQYYMMANKKYFPVIKKFGHKVVSMSLKDVDEFCEWISDSWEKGELGKNC